MEDQMLVEVYDYGKDADDYYVVYRVKELSEEEQIKLKSLVEGTTEIKDGYLFITNHFEEKYFPFGSQAAKIRPDDFVAREEIEMTLYLTSLLED
jgi:hypothetical protein